LAILDTCPLSDGEGNPIYFLRFVRGEPAGDCNTLGPVVNGLNGFYFAHIKKSLATAGKNPVDKGFPFPRRNNISVGLSMHENWLFSKSRPACAYLIGVLAEVPEAGAGKFFPHIFFPRVVRYPR